MDFPADRGAGHQHLCTRRRRRRHHTYSTFGRGVEVVMTTYHLFDLVPGAVTRGNDDDNHGMGWVRHHDRYDQSAHAAATRLNFFSREPRRWWLPAALLALTPNASYVFSPTPASARCSVCAGRRVRRRPLARRPRGFHRSRGPARRSASSRCSPRLGRRRSAPLGETTDRSTRAGVRSRAGGRRRMAWLHARAPPHLRELQQAAAARRDRGAHLFLLSARFARTARSRCSSTCPNCGGSFAPRPIRPAKTGGGNNWLGADPAGTTVKHRPAPSPRMRCLPPSCAALPPERALARGALGFNHDRPSRFRLAARRPFTPALCRPAPRAFAFPFPRRSCHKRLPSWTSGSQLTQVIARRIRECQVYSKILPLLDPGGEIRADGVAGIILRRPAERMPSMGPHPDRAIFELGVPVLESATACG